MKEIVELDPQDAFYEMHKAALLEAAQQVMSRSRSLLLVNNSANAAWPFFAHLAMRLRLVPVWDQVGLDTAATDGVNIYYYPPFAAALGMDKGKEEGIGLIGHELLHLCFHHVPWLRGKSEKQVAQMALDCVVNPICLDNGFTLPMEPMTAKNGWNGHVLPENLGLPRGKDKDWYYANLPRDKTPEGAGDDPGGCGGVCLPGDGTEADLQATEEEVQANIQEAVKAAVREAQLRSRGTLPGWLQQLVNELLHPQIDYRHYLREWLQLHVTERTTWSRPNRRHLSRGIYLPSRLHEQRGRGALAIDTSGSCWHELPRFGGEVTAILEPYQVELDVLYHDVPVQHVQHWQPGDPPFQLEASGCGGTSHVPVFEEIARQHEVEPYDFVVALTDAYSSFPVNYPAIPTLWVVAGNPSWVCPPGHQQVILN